MDKKLDEIFNFEINSKADYDAFVKNLNSIAKYESINDKERHKKIINSNYNIISISTTDIKAIAKLISKNTPMEFLKYAKDDTFEEVLIQGLVITNLKDINLQIKLLDEWKEKIDSWALCDSVISNMKIIGKSKEKDNYFDYFYNLCFSDKEYVSRLGIVTIMEYYLDEKYIDKIYQMCKSVKNQAYYVQMAIAWLISFGFIKFKEKTIDLLSEKCLDKFTQNKAISKCRDSFRVSQEDKDNLIKYRIK